MSIEMVVLLLLYGTMVFMVAVVMGAVFYLMKNSDDIERKDGEPGLVYWLRCSPTYLYYFFWGMGMGLASILWAIYQNIRYLLTGEQSRRFKDGD